MTHRRPPRRNTRDTEGRNWTYLFYGPFSTQADYRAWMEEAARSTDPLYYAILSTSTARAVGVASYLRIDRGNGAIEVGHINFSPLLQRTPAATEAMYLMMERAFSLGYRRYEWKCDSLNAPSRARGAATWASHSKASSARRRITKAEAATPPGTRPSTKSGPRSSRRSSAGSIPPTSTPPAGKSSACPT